MDWGTRWPDLAPDLVRDVAGRLHDAGDFVRLHAVCKPWRGSRDADAQPPFFRTTTTTHQFLPWLLAADDYSSTPLRFRCIFYKSSYCGSPSPPFVSQSNWVGSVDATTVRYLTMDHLGGASLHDPHTGDVTHVPQLPFCLDGQRGKDSLHGTVYRDGSVLLYNIFHDVLRGDTSRLRAALLRSGDPNWTLVERTLNNEIPRRNGGFCATYHHGRILVMEDSHWRVVVPGVAVSGDLFIRMPNSSHRSHSNYVLESRGELLWVSVHAWIKYTYHEDVARPSRTFSVSVHALEEDESATEKRRWVRKYGRSLADRMFFLGSPNSFVTEASRLGGQGGCVYFVYYNHSKALPDELFGVYRHDVVEGKTEFFERVPPGWDTKKCTWLVPQPAIAPIQEITKRSREALERRQKKRKLAPVTGPTSIIRIWKHEHCFRVMVSGLPLTVNSSKLQLLFSKYGKVLDAKLLYFKRTRNGSHGLGLLTMSMVHAHPRDALDAFNNGPDLDGCSLEVTLVKGRQRRRSIQAP